MNLRNKRQKIIYILVILFHYGHAEDCKPKNKDQQVYTYIDSG